MSAKEMNELRLNVEAVRPITEKEYTIVKATQPWRTFMESNRALPNTLISARDTYRLCIFWEGLVARPWSRSLQANPPIGEDGKLVVHGSREGNLVPLAQELVHHLPRVNGHDVSLVEVQVKDVQTRLSVLGVVSSRW